MLKRLAASRSVQGALGALAAEYLRLVWKTSRFVIEPPNFYDHIETELPVILTMWHGQHFMTPFARRHYRAKVLISRHRDGELNAIVAERLGVGVVRGSGARAGEFHRKGGVEAFREMLEVIKDGYSVASTADVPKISRRAGLGIVTLASLSERPIYPCAIATSRRFELNNWDRSTINLPFGRGALVFGDPIRVPAKADRTVLEQARLQVESALNAATARAYALVDGPAGGGRA